MSEEKHNPYVGPRTFKEVESHLFFGREREALDLVSLIISERLVLFYAQSGAGKSSLINTKLIPGLHTGDEYKVFPVGRVGGAESVTVEHANNIYMHNLLHSLLKDDSRRDDLSNLLFNEFLKNFVENGDDSYTRQLLIIDQFEELFSTYPEEWEKRKDFFMQLAQAMKDFPQLGIVLVMREDYIAYLDPYVYLLPERLRVRYYMQRLERDGALQAVTEPAKNLRPYAKGVAEQLVKNLASIKVQRPIGHQEIRAGQFIEPLQLQVVCQYLWEHLPPGTEITFEDLRLIGDVDQILVKYYDSRVSKVAEEKQIPQRLIRRWFEDKLITSSGMRNMILQGQDASGGLNNTVIEALLGDLVRAERRGGVVFFEITHDRLVEPIRTGNQKWFEENLSPLQRQASLWNDHKKNESWLWTEQALSEAEYWAFLNPQELTELEEEFLTSSRKYQDEITAKRELASKLAEEQEHSARQARKYTRGVTVFAFLVLVLAGYSLYQWWRTNELAAQNVMENAAQLHNIGLYEESVSKLLLAQELDPGVINTIQDSILLMDFCSYGSLFDNPQRVKEACERAVNLSSSNGMIRDRRGINRVLLGDLQGAIGDFEMAATWYRDQKSNQLAGIREGWVEQLKVGKNPLEDRGTLSILKAQARLEPITRLYTARDKEKVISAFLEAKRLDPNVASTMRDSSILNAICWWGSLLEPDQPEQFTDACEKAVVLAPTHGGIIDSRGLNRALLGDYPGAIADFQFAVKWFIENGESETNIAKRKAWIVALSNDQNPFIRATLEELKSEIPVRSAD